MPRTLEGTWEEIKSHETELTGRTVRVIIEPDADELDDELPPPPNTVVNESHLEALLLEGIRSGPATKITVEDWDEIRVEGRRLALGAGSPGA